MADWYKRSVKLLKALRMPRTVLASSSLNVLTLSASICLMMRRQSSLRFFIAAEFAIILIFS